MFIEENENMMAKIAINKSLLKEYKTSTDPRVVYMNDGDEFQIQLFNPETETIGAEVSINGKVIPGILVIKPGQRIWLERYLTEKSKFKFSTYEVEDTAEVSKAISNNGNITIKFYKEKEQPTVYVTTNVNWNDYNDYKNYKLTPEPITRFDYTTVSDTIADSTCLLNCDTNTAKSIASFNCASGTDYTTTCLNAAPALKRSKSISDTLSTSSIETGRVGKGSYSSQKLESVDIEFNSYWFKKEEIKILPTSRKPYTSNDIAKIYCVNCGRKLNPKYKFCPYCGEKCVLLDD